MHLNSTFRLKRRPNQLHTKGFLLQIKPKPLKVPLSSKSFITENMHKAGFLKEQQCAVYLGQGLYDGPGPTAQIIFSYSFLQWHLQKQTLAGTSYEMIQLHT